MIDFKGTIFFDQSKILKHMDRMERKALSDIGRFVRTRARSSLKRRKKVSEPGRPPSVHSKHRVRSLKFILYAYEPKNKAVVVGPVKLSTSKAKGSKTTPETHEFGGSTVVQSDGKLVPARYPRRAFMGPALEAETQAGTMADAFEGSFGR